MLEIFAPYKWEALFQRWPDLLTAFGVTVGISVLALVIALALGILVGNSILLMLFTNTLGIPAAAAKPLTEVLLFLISLSVQSLVIFRSKKGEGPHV